MLCVCVGRSQSARALPCRSMPEPAPIRAWCCMTGRSPPGAVSHHEFYPLGNILGSQLNQPGSAKVSLCRASRIMPCPLSSCHTPLVHAAPLYSHHTFLGQWPLPLILHHTPLVHAILLSTHAIPSMVNATPLSSDHNPLVHATPLHSCHTFLVNATPLRLYDTPSFYAAPHWFMPHLPW